MTLIRSLSHSSQLLWRKDTCRSWWKLQVPGPHSGAFCVNLWLSPRSLCFSKHSSNSDEGLRQVARGTKSFVWVGVKKDLWSWFLISEVLNYVKMFTVSLQSKEKLELLSPKPFKKNFFFFSVKERRGEWEKESVNGEVCSLDVLLTFCVHHSLKCTPLSTHGCQSLLSPDQPGGGFAEIFRMTHWHPPPAPRPKCWQRGILPITRVSVLVS